ncbi:homeodomain mating-type protein [Coprinellus micaceus]|uniref:Homeodomain mating-type protein n=1 Tax=Coprinellus micaceus TaxID=71717 RepID=A0A4Y7TXK3_COPMI|nr:homeodomain mating-type protein [Coprinellus micaceus]
MAIPPVDQEILASIDSIRSRFFSSVGGNLSSLISFQSVWSSFDSNFNLCCDDLQPETRRKVYDFSSVVASVAERVAETRSLCDNLWNEVSNLLDRAVASEPEVAQHGTSSPSTPYLRLASEWLFSNLHDPYPSQELRKSMATQTNSSKKDIDNWFLDARKRVGWNEMRRRHFDNKRVSIVDAAKRFFLNTDPSRPLPPTVESEFANVQLRAQELYSDKFEETPLAIRLDMSMMDMKTGLKAKVGGNDSRKGCATSVAKATRHYPSPQSSPAGSGQSLSPSPASSFSDLPSTKSKRGASVLSELEEEQRPSKRRRSYKPEQSRSPSVELRRPTVIISSEASLPSPVSSTFDETELQPPPHYTTHTDPGAHKRKRRPSNPEGLPSLKRTRTSPVSPRLQTIPNPLPRQPTTDEFNWDQLFDFSTLPPPVSSLSPEDIPGPIDVSLFEFHSWEQYGYGSLNLSPSEEPIMASSSSNALNMGAIVDFPTHSTDPLLEDSPLFAWNAYGPSEPECPEDPLSTNASEHYNPPNISSDFAPLLDQWAAPISLSDASCFLTFADPTPPTLQEAQAVPNPTTTLSESEREAKKERLRVLRAEMATLTAEIAASS